MADIPAWKRPIVRLAQSPAGAWWFINVSRHIDPPLLKATGGRVSSVLGAPVLLLKMTGAKSGKPRELPLTYSTDGEKVLLVASNGGSPKHPLWYRNLKAHPEVELLAGRRSGRYTAHEAAGAERAHSWEVVTSVYPGYNAYQGRTGGREIPVMVLEPRD
jgi:deazaflavin-dependent oxidoreductase (nitroreductase family)